MISSYVKLSRAIFEHMQSICANSSLSVSSISYLQIAHFTADFIYQFADANIEQNFDKSELLQLAKYFSNVKGINADHTQHINSVIPMQETIQLLSSIDDLWPHIKACYQDKSLSLHTYNNILFFAKDLAKMLNNF